MGIAVSTGSPSYAAAQDDKSIEARWIVESCSKVADARVSELFRRCELGPREKTVGAREGCWSILLLPSG